MKRVVPGIALGIGWLALIFLAPSPLFCLAVAVIGLLGGHEFQHMAMKDNAGHSLVLDLAVLLPILLASRGRHDLLMAAICLAFILVLLGAMGNYARIPDVLGYLGRANFSVLWIGVGLAHLVLIRQLDQGAWWLLLLAMITAGSDTGAYYAGRAWGKAKLCPQISPGKTRAGAWGGLAAALITALAVAALSPLAVSWWRLAPMVALLTAVGVMGDLGESMVKRASGVKDSGTLLAGHGGILDRGDSLLLTAPLLYYLVFFGVLG